MIGRTAVSSFSVSTDKLSALIAADVQRLVLPRQLLVWSVVRKNFSDADLAYTLEDVRGFVEVNQTASNLFGYTNEELLALEELRLELAHRLDKKVQVPGSQENFERAQGWVDVVHPCCRDYVRWEFAANRGKLAELRDRGVITSVEFERKKTELLELFDAWYDPSPSADTLERLLASPLAVRARGDCERKLEKVLARS